MIYKEKVFNIGITNSSVLIPLTRYRDNGVINNGNRKDDEPSKKPSVLEKLEEKKQESVTLQTDAVKPEKNKVKDIDLG